MRLYHGSNAEVRNPQIIKSNRALDFGKGFYLTSDLEQAITWARNTTKRRKTGVPTVSVFEYNEDNDLKILIYKEANIEWLKFVSSNRRNEFIDNEYDIIIGPVANDNTMPVINLYFSGVYDEEEALRRLLPQKLKDQVVFKSDKSLKFLEFVEVDRYE